MSDEVPLSILLVIVSRLDQVRMVRAALVGVLDHLRVREEDSMALELAVSEIVNNAVEHGYHGDEDRRIRVRIKIHGTLVQVEVIDNAAPFPESERYRLMQVAEMEEADESWSARGHGLQIVRQIVDSMVLVRVKNENVMTLSKTVKLRES